ncbi:MAG TPA: glycosyltransferase family 4 protein [Anaerolineae bacterium]|nr:glycosyltransferase family 4 protein [Anaerolineae bacterium]HOQ97359.1 glycosyltransferase family 4 protein [Anaerolineae bacterium]HPL27548.1 glycosyltransferase family 4 protein [Anaerolineae bacterium]
MGHTMRVAYFSPLAPQRTGTSSYSEELLPHLCRQIQVDAYTDDRIAATQEVGRIYPLYGYRDFAAQHERYDQLVFQLGNSPEHVPIYDLFRRYGGVVVLHELDLSTLLEAKALRHGDGWGYLREVRRHEGLGPFLRTAGDALLRGQWAAPQLAQLEMKRLVGQRAAGVIVHGRAAREHLAAHYPEAPLCEIPVGIPRPPAIDPTEAREALGLPTTAFVCIAVGPLVPEARIHVAMQAFARLSERRPGSLFVMAGEPAPGYPLHELAQSLGIAGAIRLTGHVDLATLYRYLAAADVALSLGHLKHGEAPAGLLRVMSMGKPAIVPSHPPYAQMPDHAVVKVEEGASEVSQVVAALWALASHPPLRLSYSRQAARYVQTEHALAATARQYAAFLEQVSTVQVAEGLLLREQAG